MQTFVPGSTLHFGMLAAIALACGLAIVARRHAGTATVAVGAERAVAVGYLAFWVATFVRLPMQSDFDAATDYPLQLCHWAGALSALALALPRRATRALAYFWGLALCTQALITPNLTDGPATWPFWFFWLTHGLCVAVPLYDVLARGFRPTWRDYGIACAGAALYVALVLPIDLATGWNYGFVGPTTPEVPTIVDFLGPWPGRLVPIAAIAAAAMALLMIPWQRRRRPPATRIREPWRRARRA